MLDAQAYFDRVSGHLPGDAATRASALAAAEKLGAADPPARGLALY